MRMFKITVSTYNLNTDPRVHRGVARLTHPEWSFFERAESIKEAIPLTDIIHIQEVANYTNQYGEEINSLEVIEDFLEPKGYKSVVQDVKPENPYSIKYITAYKADRFEVSHSLAFYFTKTPHQFQGQDIFLNSKDSEISFYDHTYGENAERSALAVCLLDKLTGEEIWSVNVHIGFHLEHRMEASRIILDFIKNLGADVKAIVAGDFNAFEDYGGMEQMAMFKESGLLNDITEELLLENNESIHSDSTFFAFPFDCITNNKAIQDQMNKANSKEEMDNIFTNHCRGVAGKLDSILVTSNLYKSGNALLRVNPIFSDSPNNYTEEDIKKYTIAHLQEGYAFPSDHQPVMVGIDYVCDQIK
jgi:endonuclease/exonuclease/phosphatase family metal-dependent hydrolase